MIAECAVNSDNHIDYNRHNDRQHASVCLWNQVSWAGVEPTNVLRRGIGWTMSYNTRGGTWWMYVYIVGTNVYEWGARSASIFIFLIIRQLI